MLRRFGLVLAVTVPSETARMCACGMGWRGAALLGMFLLGGLLSWMSFLLPHRVQFAPHVAASWRGAVGYATLGGELLAISGH